MLRSGKIYIIFWDSEFNYVLLYYFIYYYT